MTADEFGLLLRSVRLVLEQPARTDRERDLMAVVRSLRVAVIDGLMVARHAQLDATRARHSLEELARATDQSEFMAALRDRAKWERGR